VSSDCSEGSVISHSLCDTALYCESKETPVKTLNGCKHQGDALLLFNFALEYAFRRVQVNQDELKLNGTHQLLVSVDDVNILGGNVHTVKENAEVLVVASKEIGLEVNA